MKLKLHTCYHMSTMLLHSVTMNYKVTGYAGLFESQQTPHKLKKK